MSVNLIIQHYKKKLNYRRNFIDRTLSVGKISYQRFHQGYYPSLNLSTNLSTDLF